MTFNNFIPDKWSWDMEDKPSNSYFRKESVHFKSDKKNSLLESFSNIKMETVSGVRGNRVLNGGRYYWEITVTIDYSRTYDFEESVNCSSLILFGIATKEIVTPIRGLRNRRVSFHRKIDKWALSRIGYTCHNSKFKSFTEFLESSKFGSFETISVGVLYDGVNGTLSYFSKNGVCLGVAFTDLHLVKHKLYPMIYSPIPAEMRVTCMLREFMTLQERCKLVILACIKEESKVDTLNLPSIIKSYLQKTI